MGSTEFDLAILNGRVIDGAGNPWFKADLAIKGDEIAWMGKRFKGESHKTLDASGCFVVPGFIDAHSHADFTSLVHRDMENLVHQGITTVVAGQCGSSLAPLSDLSREEAEKSLQGSLPEGVELKLTWSTFEEYLREEEKERMGVNVAHMVGHGAVRAAAMGFEARPPTDEELDHMRELVEEAMKAGAFGLSTGLIYPPGLYAETSEIVELAKVAARFGGVYDSHIRGEGRGLMKALREALEIGFQAGIPVQISHHKIASKRLWGKSVETLKLFEEARSKGLDVTLDQYPYVAGSTSLMALLPPWVHDGGREKALERLRDEEARKKIRRDISEGIEGWENFAGELGWSNVYVTYVQSEANKPLEGLNLTEIKEKKGVKDEFEALFQLLLEEEGSASMVIFYGDEEDVKRIMRSPLHMVGTDAGSCAAHGPFRRGKPHPRHYGTYPRVLGKYVREEQTLTWEQAVRKMTSLPAQRFKIWDRGLLKPGFKADITVFNPDTIIDKATFTDPHQYPEGIVHVVVNGGIAIEDGSLTKQRFGVTLRKPATS